MTPSEIARRIDEEIAQAAVDVSDARRCQALHLQPSTGTLLRRVESALFALRQARDEIARLSAQESPEMPPDEGETVLVEGEPGEFGSSPIRFSYNEEGALVIEYEPSWERVAWRLAQERPGETIDDEPSREEYREGYEVWRAEGQRLHAALLEIWHMAEPADTADRTYGNDPSVVVAAVRAALTPTDA